MSRRPAPPSPSPSVLAAAAVVRRSALAEVRLTVATPMFGGGPSAGVVDPLHPVRGGTVRGHLRFWWRACNAHRYGSAEELFGAEAAIWGKTAKKGSVEGPSPIEVEVTIDDAGEPVTGAWTDDEHGYPSYALFPFQRQQNPPRPPLVGRKGVCFTVRLVAAPHVPAADHPRLKSAVEAALWAWITFGGVGARTRRGCGSLFCDQDGFRPPPTTAEALDWLRRRAADLVKDAPVASRLWVPRLVEAGVLLDAQPRERIAAWRKAVNVMHEFRQGEGMGRTGRFGRSRWPEADSIREAARYYAPAHPPMHAARRYYPRAELGLPIVFHFKDPGDPGDHTLQPAADGSTRMASPIILKPLMVSATEGFPMAAMLHAPFLVDPRRPAQEQIAVELKPKGMPALPVESAEVFDRAKAAAVAPLTDMGASTARAAFWAFAGREWPGGQARRLV